MKRLALTAMCMVSAFMLEGCTMSDKLYGPYERPPAYLVGNGIFQGDGVGNYMAEQGADIINTGRTVRINYQSRAKKWAIVFDDPESEKEPLKEKTE